ncbi:hypothetical protein GCM10023213_45300 [Prosthecobacter algae]|uniref:Uncharacterized protein n=1 Tax=Prosthecobacter algae TaxID=1144682 RepID=A0ABP9PT98_9BACT
MPKQPLASTARRVTLLVPAVVGSPDMAPVSSLSTRPAGRLPLLTEKAYGGVPEEAVTVAL